MRAGAIAFLAGIFLLQQFAQLPDTAWYALLLLLAPLAWRWPMARLPLWFAGGFFWALLRAQLLLGSGGLPAEFEGVDLLAEGVVATLPARSEHDVRFAFDVESLRVGENDLKSPGRVRLSWRNPAEDVRVGDRWRFTVRLKRPHGFMNPGGFDYEAWLYQQGIRATGYVRAPRATDENDSSGVPGYERLARSEYSHPLDRWRQTLSEQIAATLQDQPHRAIVAALAIGVTQDFAESQWDVLNRTGTTHLISISGLHIGFVAGLVFFAMRRLWAWSGTAALTWPAPKAAAVAALLAATVYAALAGFSVPTQRSLLMVGVVMAHILWQRHIEPSRVLALSLLAVLLLDPLAVLQYGFWLSFGAVGVILLAMNARTDAQGWWWKWGRVQWVVAIGMLPLMLVLFQRTSIIAPLANLLAVPWFNVITVPFTLAGALLLSVIPLLGDGLLQIAQWSVVPAWWFLETIAKTPWAQWTQHVPLTWTVIVAGFGVVWMLLPRGVPARWLGAFAVAPLFLVRPPVPHVGEFGFTLLDVGQGLSAVVQTAHHTLIFDTGPKFSAQFDTGDAVVLPYLRALGVDRVDRLFISHTDSDHIGGASSILRQVAVTEVMSNVPVDVAPMATRCAMQQSWQWDGVDFAVLYPPPEDSPLRRKNDNDASCVLRVSAPGGSVLLTGDIEIPSERFLLEQNAAALRSEILVVPHHGSTTSSSEAFIDAVGARYVLYPVGYRNRFGFPKAKVVERFRQRGATQLDTARSGAIHFAVTAQGGMSPQRYRVTARRYWRAEDDTHL